MKKMICALFFLIPNAFCFSQTTEDAIKKVVQEEIGKSQVKSSIDEVKSSVAELKKNLDAVNESVNKISKEGTKANEKASLIEQKNYAKRVHLILETSDFVDKDLVCLNGFKASISLSALSTIVTNLNNPNNNDLGFSLQEVIVDKVGILIKRKTNNNEADKINGIIKQILNNPITEILKNSVPAINNVVSFITNLTFSNKKISEEDLKKFLVELKDYFEYYQSLAESNRMFTNSKDEIRIKLAALEMLSKNYVIEKVSILYEKDSDSLINQDLHQLTYSYFTDNKINKLIDGINKEYSNLGASKKAGSKSEDPRLNFPITTSSQAQYLAGELESLSNQYINSYKEYITNVLISLEFARKLNPSKNIDDRINAKKKQLQENLNEWISSFKNNLNVQELRQKAQILAVDSN